MQGIDRLLVTPLTLRPDTALSGVAAGASTGSGTAGLGMSTAGADAASIQGQDIGANQSGGANRAAAGSAATRGALASRAVFSQDARALDAILQLPGETPQVNATRPLCPVSPEAALRAAAQAAAPGQMPSVVAGSYFTALLAQSLTQSLASSGLFYESHLVEWAAGQRERASLDNEPQSRLPQAGRDETADSAAPSVLSSARAALDAWLGNSDSTAPTPAAPVTHIHPDALPIVRQQLELMQTPMLRWQGEAWPGTAMDWEIERREEPRHGPDTSEAAPAWRMRLTLQLPAIGTVDAELQLSGTRLSARLKAHADGASTLLDASDELRRRIAAAGLELRGLTVRELSGGTSSGGAEDGA